VAVVSGPAGKLAGHYGFRRVLMVGFTVFAAGLLWYVWRVGIAPDYVRVWLPGTIIVGLGIGLTFPVISAAAVSSLEAKRYAVGSAVNQTARQVGGALGVATLVVILGAPTSAAQALHGFRNLWWYVASMAVLAGVMATLLGPHPPTAPVPASAESTDEALALEEILDGELLSTRFHQTDSGSTKRVRARTRPVRRGGS
jgi:MFS family permease